MEETLCIPQFGIPGASTRSKQVVLRDHFQWVEVAEFGATPLRGKLGVQICGHGEFRVSEV